MLRKNAEIIVKTSCCQTLLLCTASLNNMTRIEPTAVYSVMSQDTVDKLQQATEQRGPGASIFLYVSIWGGGGGMVQYRGLSLVSIVPSFVQQWI